MSLNKASLFQNPSLLITAFHPQLFLFPPHQTMTSENEGLLQRFITFPNGDIKRNLSKLLSHFSCGQYCRSLTTNVRSQNHEKICVKNFHPFHVYPQFHKRPEISAIKSHLFDSTFQSSLFFLCLCMYKQKAPSGRYLSVEIDIWKCRANNHRANLHFHRRKPFFLCWPTPTSTNALMCQQ